MTMLCVHVGVMRVYGETMCAHVDEVCVNEMCVCCWVVYMFMMCVCI